MPIIFPHYAHAKTLFVKQGQAVKRGQVLGLVGKTGTGSPHLHFETKRDLINGVNFYPYWKTRGWINQHYANPSDILAMPGFVSPMVWDRLGYDYLQWAGNVWHPGKDLNFGWGSQDEGMPFIAIRDGLVRYAAFNSGWGNHVILECQWDIEKPLITRVNEALREAKAPVTPKTSEHFQAWVIAGKPGSYRELVDDIKGFLSRKEYPFD